MPEAHAPLVSDEGGRSRAGGFQRLRIGEPCVKNLQENSCKFGKRTTVTEIKLLLQYAASLNYCYIVNLKNYRSFSSTSFVFFLMASFLGTLMTKTVSFKIQFCNYSQSQGKEGAKCPVPVARWGRWRRPEGLPMESKGAGPRHDAGSRPDHFN